MTNIVLGYSNQIDSSTLATTTGTWSASFPQANLKNKLLSKIALTTTNSLVMTFTATAIKCVGVIRTNLPLGTTYRLVIGTYDSTSLTTIVDKQDLIFYIPTAQTGTATLTITSTQPISIGRLFAGTAFSPSVNNTYGSSLGYQTKTTFDVSIGGIEYPKVLPMARTFSFTLDWLSSAEALGTVLEIQRVSDITAEILLIADSSDTAYGYRRNFMGRLSTLSALKNPYAGYHQGGFEIVEIL